MGRKLDPLSVAHVFTLPTFPYLRHTLERIYFFILFTMSLFTRTCPRTPLYNAIGYFIRGVSFSRLSSYRIFKSLNLYRWRIYAQLHRCLSEIMETRNARQSCARVIAIMEECCATACTLVLFSRIRGVIEITEESYEEDHQFGYRSCGIWKGRRKKEILFQRRVGIFYFFQRSFAKSYMDFS